MVSYVILSVTNSDVVARGIVNNKASSGKGRIERGMGALREFKNSVDVNIAMLPFTDDDPYWIPILNVLKAKKRSLTDCIRVFGYASDNPILWICVVNDESTNTIYIWPSTTENVTDEALEDALKQFNECYGIRGWLFCPHKITDKVIEICNGLTEGVDKWHCSDGFYLFYMNKEQQKNFSEKKAELPSEYRLDDVRPDSDGRSKWYRTWYECWPCLAVRRGDELIDIVYVNNDGFYWHSNLTLSKEVEKAVESAVQIRIWQKWISEQLCPLQRIYVKKEKGINYYSRSESWTRLEDADRKPIIVDNIRR